MKSLFKMAKASGTVRVGCVKDNDLAYSIIKSGKAKAAMFAVGAKLCKSMRWIIGDRIDVLYDPQLAEGQLVRCQSGGWALTGKNPDAALRVRLSFKPEFELHEVTERIDLAVQITDNTIVFAFPIQYRKPLVVTPKA